MKKITLSLIGLFFTSGMIAQTYTTGTMALLSNGGTDLSFSAKIDVTATTVTLTLVGPSTGWLAIGFDNTSMADSGDVVLFDGTTLSDRNFQGFAVEPSVDARQDWTVTSNTVSGGLRTVIGTRARSTGDANDYTFSASAQALNLVYARKVANFAIGYHGSNSCGTTVSNLTLGTDEFNLDSFKVFPNPAKGFTNIELPSNIEAGLVKIYDALGRLVKSESVSATENKINTSELTSGSYMVVLRTDYGNATKTLIIE